MSDIRIQAKTGVTADTIVITDIFFIDSASGGTVRKLPVSELIKIVLGGDITAGTAMASAAVILDADKKVASIGGITMTNVYVPAADGDVVTKKYLDETINQNDQPVLIKRVDHEIGDFTKGVAKDIISLENGDIILGIYAYVKTAFNDTTASLIDIGVTSDTDYFEANLDVSTTGMKAIDDAIYPYRSSGSEAITITYNPTDEDGDTGGIEVYIHYAKPVAS